MDGAAEGYVISPDELEARLTSWGQEYCGSGLMRSDNPDGVSTGPSVIATLLDHHGFTPDSQIAKLAARDISDADEIEQIVLAMRRGSSDGACNAECLRARYLRWGPDEERQVRHARWAGHRYGLHQLKRISADEFYSRVDEAREYVASRIQRRVMRRLAA